MHPAGGCFAPAISRRFSADGLGRAFPVPAFSFNTPTKEKLQFVSDIFGRRKLKDLCGTTVQLKELKTIRGSGQKLLVSGNNKDLENTCMGCSTLCTSLAVGLISATLLSNSLFCIMILASSLTGHTQLCPAQLREESQTWVSYGKGSTTSLRICCAGASWWCRDAEDSGTAYCCWSSLQMHSYLLSLWVLSAPGGLSKVVCTRRGIHL